MPESRGVALQLNGVRKTYSMQHRRIEVLRSVDLTVESGEVCAVVGASGSGKSTLLSLVGLLDRPSAGTVLYDGRPLLAAREDVIEEFRNRYIGFIFQFHHLLPEFTALENVMMPAVIAGMSMSDSRTAARDLLDRVGLADRTDHAPGELSGGEQQRVALARALVMKPRLVLADEPTGNLDPATGTAIHELLLQLNEELGTTLIVATHNLALAQQLPRCLRIEGGAITEGAAA
ncbi:MAG: ABC transporter ATP-binding protein [Proteobacteria bacterium]|nr:ABC transporter ATP-binding protein [Pseudomonadota bacterium]